MTVIVLLYLVVCSGPISGNLLLYKTLNGLFKIWNSVYDTIKNMTARKQCNMGRFCTLSSFGGDHRRNNSYKVPFKQCVLLEGSLTKFYYWLSLLPTSKTVFSFLIYCVEVPETFFFFLI